MLIIIVANINLCQKNSEKTLFYFMSKWQNEHVCMLSCATWRYIRSALGLASCWYFDFVQYICLHVTLDIRWRSL